jgi:glucose/arabinose dehydrogenase
MTTAGYARFAPTPPHQLRECRWAASARRARARLASSILAVPVLLLTCFVAHGATVPSGFVDSVYVDVPADVTAMQFAPDGRLFIAQQGGQLRVVRDGVLLATPFVTLPVDANGERGVLGVAFDPAFATNRYVYVHYTARSPVIHNRVSRFTANGDVAVAGSEVVLLELPALTATNHNGGAIHFGNDGKLYVAVGDNAHSDDAQSLANPFGKVLRINRDGSIPTGNPFYARTTGVNRAIWALGLRNPFTTAFQRSTGRLYINDVGRDTYEEINLGKAGGNYGWPLFEGPSSNPAFVPPIYFYPHDGTTCAIVGGAFYEPEVPTFPAAHHGKYFFADLCAGWIRRLDPETRAVSAFATGLAGPVDLKVGPDGALYYLARYAGRVGRISYAGSGQPPVIGLQPQDRTVAVGQSVTFKVGASGSTPLAFQWRRNGTAIAGATKASYTRTNVQLADNGASFDVVVSNAFGRATSEAATLTVLQNTVPTASITQPVAGTTYAAGNVVQYTGTGNDAEDGVLPASAFTWWVNLHHDDHVHPFVPPVTGAKSGSFTIPTTGETSPNVYYRIHLRVRDSAGLTRSVKRDIFPRTSTITLATNPTGLQLKLDGQPVTTPYRFVGVVGMQRRIEAVSPQVASGTNWTFASWSDGGARSHTIRTPSGDTTYTARYTTP